MCGSDQSGIGTYKTSSVQVVLVLSPSTSVIKDTSFIISCVEQDLESKTSLFYIAIV